MKSFFFFQKLDNGKGKFHGWLDQLESDGLINFSLLAWLLRTAEELQDIALCLIIGSLANLLTTGMKH